MIIDVIKTWFRHDAADRIIGWGWVAVFTAIYIYGFISWLRLL